jgi:DNA polymerase-1
MFQSSAKSIAAALHIAVEVAEGYIAKFFSRMMGVDRWIRFTKKHAAEKGYVESPIGRRRRFWGYELPLSYEGRRSQMARNDRQAVNAPIQGTACDAGMLGGVCSLMDYILANNRNWLIQNVVHDSALLQVPLDEVAEAMQAMEDIFVVQAQARMEKLGLKFNLPLAIEVECGLKWGSLKKWNGTVSHAHELQRVVTEMSAAVAA